LRHKRHIRVAFSSLLDPVRVQLHRYQITASIGPDSFYDTPGEALEDFHAPRHLRQQVTAPRQP
jgi:hypothetical protein